MLLQEAAAAGAHPLAGTAAEWIWLVPILPLIGFLINGLLALTSVAKTGPKNPSTHHAHHDDHGDAHGHGRGPPVPALGP
ncbi:MAG TPA: hypothetical protein PLX31_23720, partial [Gemmatimonadaceae bacterium]|nr:hypothetical protein [Gemmatimonadaceae bacterium]